MSRINERQLERLLAQGKITEEDYENELEELSKQAQRKKQDRKFEKEVERYYGKDYWRK